MRRGGEGATLVEVVLAVVIFSIIGGVVAESLFVGLRTTTETERRVVGSLDRQLISTYFFRDAQSAEQVGTETCGPAGPDVIVSLVWKDVDESRVTSYVLDPAEDRLLRRHCQNGTLVAENSVAAFLADENPVSVSCAPDPDLTDGDPCPSDRPTAVTMTLKDQKNDEYVLSASRRVA